MSSTSQISSHKPRYHRIYPNDLTNGGWAVSCNGCDFSSPITTHRIVAEGVFEVHLVRMVREAKKQAWLNSKLIPPNWHRSWNGVLHLEIPLRHRINKEFNSNYIAMMCGRRIHRQHIAEQTDTKQICERCKYKLARWLTYHGLFIDPVIQLSYVTDSDLVERKQLPKERLFKATDRMKSQYQRETILRFRVVELEATVRQLNDYVKIQFGDRSVVLKTLLDGSEITVPRPYIPEHKHVWSDGKFPICVLCNKSKYAVEREQASQPGTDST